MRAESRGGSFALGVHGSAGLLAGQARYQDLVPKSYRQAGVAQIRQNVRSALSVGLSPADPRSNVFMGTRYVLSSNNGRSDSTAEASPVFDEAPEGGAA